MTAAEIAAILGNAHRSASGWRCKCLLHGSRGPTLALRDGNRGLIVHCHGGCPPGKILAELRLRGLLGERIAADAAAPDPAIQLRRWEAEAADRQRRIALARDMWESSHPASGTVVERYLRSRGIEIPVPPCIRFIGMHTPYGWHPPSGERRPVMVAAVEHVACGLVAVSRSYLATDGSMRATLDMPRLFTGSVAGAAVRVGDLRPDTPLIIAEGIESALAASELLGWPAWAALSAGGIDRLILPAEARDVVITCDHDASGVGERGARRAALRWAAEGRRVRLVIPDQVGADPNDLLRRVRHAI
jgi:putative DNA primase/helicase